MLRIVGPAIRFSPLVFGALYGAWNGAGTAVGIVAVVATVAVLIGVALLRTASVGSFTWRNLVGSWLLPWGHVFGARTLPGIALGAWFATIVLACIGAYGWSEPWLLAAWLVDAIALRMLMRSYVLVRGDRLQRRLVQRVMAIVVGLALAGLVASLVGRPMVGAVVAGGAVGGLGLVYGLFVLMFVVLRPRF